MNLDSRAPLVIYIAHRFDIAYYANLFRVLPDPERWGPLKAIIDPSASLDPMIVAASALNPFLDGREILLLDEHRSSGLSHRVVSNAKRLVQAKSTVGRWDSEGAIFLLNNKCSTIGHMICSLGTRVLLIQQEGDKLDRDRYKFDSLKSLRANAMWPLTRARWKSVYVSRSDRSLQVHNVKYPRVSIARDTRNASTLNRVAISSTRLLSADAESPVLWIGSRCFDWSYFGGDSENSLRSAIDAVAARHKGKLLVFKPRSTSNLGEYNLLQRLWQGPLEISGFDGPAEAMLERKPWSSVYSIGSTASRSACHAGIPSQVLYRELGFPSDVIAHYDTIFMDLPSSFYFTDDAVMKWPPEDQEPQLPYTEWLEQQLDVLRGLSTPH